MSSQTRSFPFRPLVAGLFLPLTIRPASAEPTPPPGIYTISSYGQFGRPEMLYSGLSGDGSIVRAATPNGIWSYPTGFGTFFPAGSPTLRMVFDASPDMSILLGLSRESGFVITTRDGSATTRLDMPDMSPRLGNPSALSPNGRYAAGAGGPNLFMGDRDAFLWSAHDGFRVLDRGPDFDATESVSVTNEGTVYANGYEWVETLSPNFPGGFFRHTNAIRWTADGALEKLSGTDDLGRPWTLREILDIGPDGANRLGWATRERESASGSALGEFESLGVFNDSGVSWTVWDEELDALEAPPYSVGMSADGSLVYGHYQRWIGASPPTDAPQIWTREGGEMAFQVYLQTLGIDTTNWEIGLIRDVSDDGKTFLVHGSAVGGTGYQLLIVVPEPRVALLLGLGLGALTCLRPFERVRG
jgi:hypothetical protein